jgi:two-component system nitrate/nitrite response regulator NarL
MSCVSIVIADCQPVVLCGLASVLGAENDFNVVASCSDGTKCLEAIRDRAPDIALIDSNISGLPALEILAAVASEQLCTRVVFFAASVDAREVAAATAGGAYGVVTKQVASEILVRCLRQVAEGRKLLPLTFGGGEGRAPTCRARDAAADNVLTLLTERERQIMQLVSQGLSNKEIGQHLDISDGTIKVHLHNIFQKLAIRNRATLAALAVSHQDEPDEGEPDASPS